MQHKRRHRLYKRVPSYFYGKIGKISTIGETKELGKLSQPWTNNKNYSKAGRLPLNHTSARIQSKVTVGSSDHPSSREMNNKLQGDIEK